MSGDSQNSSPGRNDCAICYAKAVYPTQVPCCNNRFCFLCIKGVFTRHGSCPLCRAPLDSELFEHPSFSQGIRNEVPPSDSQGDDLTGGASPPRTKTENTGAEDGSSTSTDSEGSTSQLPSDVKPTQEQLTSLLSLPSTSSSFVATQDLDATQPLPDVMPNLASALSQFAPPASPVNDSTPQRRSPTPRSGVQWYYSGRRDGWWRYDPSTERHIERAYNDDSDGSYTAWISGFQYNIDFPSMRQVRADCGVSRRVKRILPEEIYRFHNSLKGIAGIYYPRGGAN